MSFRPRQDILCFLKRRTPLILFAIFLASPQMYVYSQQSDDSTFQYKLDSVIVTAGRYPVSLMSSPLTVSVIDEQSLRSVNNILTVKDAFVKIPGVIVSNRFNQAQGDKITIRGIGTRTQFGVRGIKILLDGIPLTLPDGQSSLNNLNIAAVKRIDIIRGPSSVMYGNASGGVIYFNSKPESPGNFYFTPGITAGSFNLIRGDFDLGGNLFNGSYSLNAYTSVSDGYRDHSQSKFSGINLVTDHDLSERLNLTTVNNFYHSPYLLNPGSLNKEDSKNNPQKSRSFIKNQGAGKKVWQFQTGIKLDYKLTGKSNFTATLYGAARSLFNSIPGRIVELDRLTGGIRTEYKTNFNLLGSSAKFSAGVDLEHQFDKRIEFVNEGVQDDSADPENVLENIVYGEKLMDQDESVTGLGIFSIIELPVTGRLAFSAGARYDNYTFSVKDKFYNEGSDDSGEITMNELSPLLGITYRASKSFNIYGNYSTSFQTPTTSELSNKPDGSGGFNENLQPEDMNIIEAGIRGFILNYRLYYNAAVYRLFVKNMLIPYQAESPLSEEVYYRNAGESGNTGFELSLQWQPRLFYYLAFSYSYMNFKYEDFEVEQIIDTTPAVVNLSGNYVPGIPQHTLNIVSGYNITPDLLTEIRFNWTDSYYANDFNGPEPGTDGNNNDFINDEYFTFGLSIAYALQLSSFDMNFKIGVENIFDVRYNGAVVPNASGNNFFEPSSGRAVYFTLNATL